MCEFSAKLIEEKNGVKWFEVKSSYNGPKPTILRVLAPSTPTPKKILRFIYVLPVVQGVNLENVFGDGLEELRFMNIHNDYNAIIIAPSFGAEPWYADHETDTKRHYESFMVCQLAPWVKEKFSVTGSEESWLLGFSKSGFGAVTMIFRNPTVFNAAAVWDFPAEQADAYSWHMKENYGTNANFRKNYCLNSDWIKSKLAPFQKKIRLWISVDNGTHKGDLTFNNQVLNFVKWLRSNNVKLILAGGRETRVHSWTSGWLQQAVAGLACRD